MIFRRLLEARFATTAIAIDKPKEKALLLVNSSESTSGVATAAKQRLAITSRNVMVTLAWTFWLRRHIFDDFVFSFWISILFFHGGREDARVRCGLAPRETKKVQIYSRFIQILGNHPPRGGKTGGGRF